MIDRLHDIAACMLRLSACSGVCQIAVQARDHRLSMYIANPLHLTLLTAPRTALSEFQAPRLCCFIRQIVEKKLDPLTDMLRQAPATHSPPRGAFLVARIC